MQPDQVKYIRKGNGIFKINDAGVPILFKDCGGRNAAKRESAKLQRTEGHGLGRGLVRVVRVKTEVKVTRRNLKGWRRK